MHDIRFIREAPEAFDRALTRRGLAPMSSDILALDADRRAKILLDELTLDSVPTGAELAGAFSGSV